MVELGLNTLEIRESKSGNKQSKNQRMRLELLEA